MIISGFSGIGKTYTAGVLGKEGVKVLDLDSSNFDDVQKYTEVIMESSGVYDIVLVSTHPELLDALEKEGVPYTLVIPSLGLKEEYKKRWTTRGSSKEFVDFMYYNFNEFVSNLLKRDCRKIILGEGQYLVDVLEIDENETLL